jgi:hypothetical protein
VLKNLGTLSEANSRRSATFETGPGNTNAPERNNTDDVQLFDGLRVEEYMVDDEENPGIRLFDGKRIEEYLVSDSDSSSDTTSEHGDGTSSDPEELDEKTDAPGTIQSGDRVIPPNRLIRRDTPPFLTWAWLSSDLEKTIPAQRLVAETLFTIMQDIDRNLRGRGDAPYLTTSESTLAELEMRTSRPGASTAQNSSPVTKMPLSEETHPSHVTNDVPSPWRQTSDYLLSGDIVLDPQKKALHEAINDLTDVAKDFVGLFLPCNYHHPVLNRIWGALLGLIQVRRHNSY